MKQTNRNTASKAQATKAAPTKPARTSAYREAVERAHDRHDGKIQKMQLVVGYIVVALSVLAAIALCLLHQLPVPVAVGLLILVGIRVYALKSELKRQDANADRSCVVVPPSPKRAAKRA